MISLTSHDTDRLLAMLSRMPEETLRWSMAPYRREWVERWLNTPSLIHIGAEHSGEIVGFVCIEEYTHPKRMGVGYLGTYFHRDYIGAGLETAMMELILESAKKQGVHKVDAGAVAEDEGTISLLVSLGFETEGRNRDDFLADDGTYRDVLAMGKILD
ncbi:MAG: GNAT family N-acetyltransferase [Candidatus Bathyarchaeota archaeon]|nr:MAG: GNAT family N-acetyltransferase [Candidatus Bathyarchaeota archaeon]